MSNPVIENVRRALGRTAESPMGGRPAVCEPRQAASPESEIDAFLGEIKKLSGVGARLNTAGAGEALSALVEQEAIRQAVVWNTPLLKKLDFTGRLQALGVGLVPPDADKDGLAGCDLGVTEADFILPETGTLALRSSGEKPRVVSLLPRVHLAVVTPAAIRPDMHQVFAESKDGGYLVFITGPSRTADIELTVTLGVHGPKNLYVWIVAD